MVVSLALAPSCSIVSSRGGRRGRFVRCQVAQPLPAAVTRSAPVSTQEPQPAAVAAASLQAAALSPAEAAAAAAPGDGAAAEEPVSHDTPLPRDVLREFEHKLEADLQSVAVTLTAVTGVIIFWRGVWSLLDFFMGDSLFGDVCCIFVGLTIVLWIRLSGVKVAPTFWPPS